MHFVVGSFCGSFFCFIIWSTIRNMICDPQKWSTILKNDPWSAILSPSRGGLAPFPLCTMRRPPAWGPVPGGEKGASLRFKKSILSRYFQAKNINSQKWKYHLLAAKYNYSNTMIFIIPTISTYIHLCSNVDIVEHAIIIILIKVLMEHNLSLIHISEPTRPY